LYPCLLSLQVDGYESKINEVDCRVFNTGRKQVQVLKLIETAQKKKHFYSRKPANHKEYCLIQRAHINTQTTASACTVEFDELHDTIAPFCAAAHDFTIKGFF